MSSTVTACAKHRVKPAWGYSECPGCEVEGLRAEIERLNSLLIEREATRIGQSLQRHDDQKQIDELVALGIQQDKDEIARLRAENERWRQNYEHLIEQHMPRTGHGCEEGWSRVVEARELQAENAELRRLHGYWKQRAKSAEGHLFSSDFQAACRQLHSMTSFHETPIAQLDVSQQAKIHRAVCGVLATVNHQRAARRPKDLDQPITEEQP